MGTDNNAFNNAISRMSGDSGNAITTSDTVDVIDAAIRLIITNNQTAVGSLQSIRDMIVDGSYTKEKLVELVPLRQKPSTEAYTSSDIKLTDLQELRFKYAFPAFYEEYIRDSNKDITTELIEDIVKQYPEPPHLKNVYYSASGDSAYFHNYRFHWSTYGKMNGEAIAWAFDGPELKLMHFQNNVFDIGIALHSCTFITLMNLRESGCEAYINDSPFLGGISVMCKKTYDRRYIFYFEETQVMSIREDMMWQICDAMENKTETPKKWVEEMECNLSRA